MNELIAKLQAKAAAARARMAAALTAGTADGVTEDDKAKRLAEFDAAEKEKDAAEAELARATRLDHAERNAAAPVREPITQKPFVPVNSAPTAAGVVIPANCRKYSSLKAFAGPNAEKEAYLSGLFVAACFFGHRPSADRLAENGIVATLSTIDNTRGGYFVPDVMDNTILRLTEEYGIARRLAKMVPMSSDTWSKPRWTGGVTAYWVGEGAAPTQSSPTWDRTQLVAKNLAAFDKITNQLNEDAVINLGDEWAAVAAIAFASAEDNAAFNGDGTSTYGGITGLLPKITAGANAAGLYTATGHTTLSQLTLSDFETVQGMFPNYPGANPVWLCQKSVYAASISRLQDAMPGNRTEEIAGRRVQMFLGYPVEFVNVMPKAAAVTSGVTGILFADMAISTMFGDRRQRAMRVTEVNDDALKQQQTLFMAERVDIVNHTVVDPLNASNPGPVIGLKIG